MKKTLAALIFLVSAFGAGDGQANTTRGQSAADAFMTEFRSAGAPIGYVQFCRDYPDDCAVRFLGPRRIELTPARWHELVDVNDLINDAVTPVTDEEYYGVAEQWTYPIEYGDCEDYVLLKRRELMERGWPASALLVTVVRDERGDGHAVLTVTTSSGDLVLDNQHSEVRVWSDTPYDYLKRQSARDPSAWVSLRDDRMRQDMPVAGTSGN